jgi:hypothetical protein
MPTAKKPAKKPTKPKPRTYWAVEVETQDGTTALYTENEMGDHFEDEQAAQWEADEWNGTESFSARVGRVTFEPLTRTKGKS